MDHTVALGGKPIPAWPQLHGFLQQRGLALQMRMIDGQLAFPDQEPPDGWRELRVGSAPGMVTLRRTGDDVVCTIWGNADLLLRQLWNALAWALAELGGGQVVTAEGTFDPTAFRRRFEMPAGVG
jgi:hypothetical protein